MSNESTIPSGLSAEEIIATVGVLLLAAAFLLYFLWPNNESPTVTGLQNNSSAAVAAAPVMTSSTAESKSITEQQVLLTGSGEPGSRVTVSMNGTDIGTVPVDSYGKWQVRTQRGVSDELNINVTQIASVKKVEATAKAKVVEEPVVETAAEIVEEKIEEPIVEAAPAEPEIVVEAPVETVQETVTAVVETPKAAPIKTAPVITEMVETVIEEAPLTTVITEVSEVSELVESTPAISGAQEPLITFLDRDRVTDELVLSGTTDLSAQHLALLINGVTSLPIQSDENGRWNYAFKAAPGEYYARAVNVDANGTRLNSGSLPTLYNISLSPVSDDSSDAGATINLMSGEYYSVQPGDTVYSISQAHSLTAQDLMMVNGLRTATELKSNSTLFVPK